jgi:hypothetical protein
VGVGERKGCCGSITPLMVGVTEGESEWGRGRGGNSIDGKMSGERKSWRFLVQGGRVERG